MRMNDVGYFYRPRYAAPPMTEEEYMGPYYGMNDDELQSYSTQIVPPQDLFGLGQAGPLAAIAMGPTFGSIFAGLFVAAGIYYGTQKLKPVKRPKTFAERNGNFLLKNRGAAAVVSGVLVGGLAYWIIGKMAEKKSNA